MTAQWFMSHESCAFVSPARLPDRVHLLVFAPRAGTIGGLHATPLVNPPESAIVALGRVQKLPRYNEAGLLVPK